MAALRTLLFLALIAVSSGQTSDCSYRRLLDHLNLTTSDAALEMMRPVKNWTSPTLVVLEMLLYGILDVDEKSQTVTSQIWMTKYWTNEFLTWDSSDFCGIDELCIPTSMVWIPDIIIQQEYVLIDQRCPDCSLWAICGPRASDSGALYEDPLAILNPSGLLTTFTRQRLTFTCQFNLYKFPFDVQTCNITFLSMCADVRSLVLGSAKNDSTLTTLSEKYMVTQGEWDLKYIKIDRTNIEDGQKSHSTLVYTVTLGRKPLLYVINFIVPLVYLLILDLGSFFISEARGEKLGFKVTVLLSISVLLLILKDILPSTEDNLPIIATLCVSVFTLVWLSVLEAMLVSFLIDIDGCCGQRTPSSVEDEVYIRHRDSPGAKEDGHVEPEKGRSGDADLLKQILDKVKAAHREVGSQEKERRKPGCCRRLAQIIDTLFFSAYFVTVVTFVLFICIEWMGV